MKNLIFCVLIFVSLSPSIVAQAFRHIATSANISGNFTTIDHSATNNRPNALLFITSHYGTSRIYHSKAIGVWYNANRWTIFNQDRSSMTNNAQFNVLVVERGENAFIHSATTRNTSSHITTIDHPRLNGNASARIMVTQNYGSAGPYNNKSIGVYYTGSRWAIFNQDRTAMPTGAQFNVLIDNDIFEVEATSLSISSNWTAINNSQTNNRNDALLFVTQYWTAVYNPQEIGVWYNSNRWNIYNQSMADMPRNAKFFVLANAGTPPPSCATISRESWFNPLQTLLSTAAIRVNNYTPTKHEFNETGERAFHKPNDCFFSVNSGGRVFSLPFSLDMVEGGPDKRCKAYINDWNSHSVNVGLSDGRILIRIGFENAGTELITNCYNNACCEGNPFCPGAGCPDYELNNAWMNIFLTPTLSSGQLSYDVEVALNVDMRELGVDPCTNNFWAFLCDWGLIPRSGDRSNMIRQGIEGSLLALVRSSTIRGIVEPILNSAVRSSGVDISRCRSVAIEGGNLVFR